VRAIDFVQTGLAKIAVFFRRESTFVCGQCERWQRCGLPPSSRCITKLEQIERERDRVKRLTLIAY
jgi:hypothetical protein